MNKKDKAILQAFFGKVAEYADRLKEDAETVCNYRDGLRLAGSVDALETLNLIDAHRAEQIRNMAGVYSKRIKP